jgi:hypothetical protein
MLAGALVIGLACGDGTAPPVPSSMVLTSGNNQSGLPGVMLATPLAVTLSGAAGAPFPGARVNWTVTSGSAALGSAQSTTDANGRASTTVTIGVVPGNVVVTAAAAGVPNVLFQLTALDPCDVTMPFSADSVGAGTLTAFDCQFNGPYFTDFYSFTLPAQAGVQVAMTSSFDTYLELYHVTGPFFAYNDDRDTLSTDSRINIIGAAGTYVFSTSTYVGNVTGTYGMSVAPHAQTIAGCPSDFQQTWITRGVAITEQIEATDCVVMRGAAGRAYSDRVLITLTPARALDATVASAAFNPRIELYVWTSTGPALIEAVNGTAGTANLVYTPPSGGIYRLEITSPDSVQTGAYTLNVAGPLPNALGEAIPLPGAEFAPLSRARPRKAPTP